LKPQPLVTTSSTVVLACSRGSMQAHNVTNIAKNTHGLSNPLRCRNNDCFQPPCTMLSAASNAKLQHVC
jgi:hypothetical protein